MRVLLANHAPTPFEGWVRTTVDKMPPHPAGDAGSATYVVGRQVGEHTHVVDLLVRLAAGERREVDLAESRPSDWVPRPVPSDPVGWFGGDTRVNGVPMTWVGLRSDGAGYTAHLRGRVQRMFVVDVWLTWYPDHPAHCHGEALVTCSNSAVPDLTETVLPPGIELRFGDAIVLPFGGEPWRLVAPGTTFGDGQARVIPLTFVWPRHIRSASDWASAGVAAQRGIGALGIEKLLPDGNPTLPSGFDPLEWAGGRLAESIRRLHTWDIGMVGPNKVSGDTGAQEDQLFVRGEAFAPNGVGLELVAYLGACKMANRPCHHREPDGTPLDAARHPQRLVLWDGRAHWHLGVSQDQLGKPTALTQQQANGWWGPDVEHWLINTLAAGARLTGSPALQELLAMHARIYLLQWTTTPGWSTSQAYAARAQGYEGLNAVHLWRDLEDRDLAHKVLAHWIDRFRTVLRPFYQRMRNEQPSGFFMDCRLDDPRLGPGWWWMPWQQGVGCYGLDLAGQVFDEPEAREWARDFARQIVPDAWVQEGWRWHSRAQMPVGGGGTHDESFNYFGCSLAVAVVLRHDPQDERARAIWEQLVRDGTRAHQVSWLAPGVQ